MKRIGSAVGTMALLAAGIATVPSTSAASAPPPAAADGHPATAPTGFVHRPADAPRGWPGDRLGPRPTVQVGNQTYDAANPYLAMLPSTEGVDWRYWRQRTARASARAALLRARTTAARIERVYDEQEPANRLGANDTRATAETVAGFGTGAGEDSTLRIKGTLARERVGTVRIGASREDDGSIPLARTAGIGNRQPGIRTTRRIGDGPHGEAGSGRGDFDYYRVVVPRGHQIVTSISARGKSELEPLVALWGEKGRLVDFAFPRGNSASLTTPVRAGTYYVMASGCCPYPRSRFRSGSGTGAESEGAFKLSIAVTRTDRDVYAVNLDRGDVLGGTVRGARSLEVYGPGGTKVFGSGQDASFLYPTSILPGGGAAVVDHVAARSGRYYVAVQYGADNYRVDLEAYRPGLEREPSGSTQTLYLDFNGERLNTNIFGGPGVRELSPLSAFLDRWGLHASQRSAVIDAVIANVRASLQDDLVTHGHDDVAIRLLNSRDHADPWGEPGVSRVIVGGTIRESGIPTIGIAQSIDPGNLDQQETALVLLDYVSRPARDRYSINHYLTDESDRVAFIGQVLGNLVSHEAGHFLGNWHVDQFDGRPNLMDQGGNPRAFFGPGPDRVGGTADDRDVRFGVNRLNPFEGFTGFEDTRSRTALGLTP